MKRRIAHIGLIGLFLALWGASAVMAAEPVALRETIVVDDHVVKLSDIFTNAGPNANAAVAYAPAPGRKAVFDVKWLYRVARAYGLAWRPMSRHDRAVIQRRSIIIPNDEIESGILAKLLENGASDDLSVEISQRSFRLHVPADSNGQFTVQDVMYDDRSNRFTAVIQAPANDPQARTYRVIGHVYRILEVPVLAHRISKGEEIGEDDIKWKRVRADRVHRNILVDVDDLIGKAPRRAMRAGRAIRQADVRMPLMVTKKSIVTLVLKHGAMSLTTKGKALESGGEGEWIRVANNKTGTIVEGEITGPNVVAVELTTRIAVN